MHLLQWFSHKSKVKALEHTVHLKELQVLYHFLLQKQNNLKITAIVYFIFYCQVKKLTKGF